MERSIRSRGRVRGRSSGVRLGPLPALAGACVALGALAASPRAAADVTTQERVSVGGAVGALVKMTLETTTAISDDRARIDTKVECGNALVRMFCPKPSAQIVRLDRDTTWQLDPGKRTWYAESFEDFRRRQQEAAARMREAQASQAPEPSVDEQSCELQPASGESKRTGEKATLAGRETERTTITVTQACRDRRTGDVCEMRWSADQWLTTEDVAHEEQQRFWQAYAKKLLQDETAVRSMAAPALAYLDRHRTSFAELARRLAEQPGTPLKSTLALAVGGAGCRDAAGGASGSGSEDPGAGGGGADRQGLGSSIAGAIGGALFKRSRAKEAQEATAAGTTAPPGFTTVFEMTTEVKTVETAGVPSDRFEIPAGFKQIDAPTR